VRECISRTKGNESKDEESPEKDKTRKMNEKEELQALG